MLKNSQMKVEKLTDCGRNTNVRRDERHESYVSKEGKNERE